MKLLIILGIAVCTYAAKLDRTYLPPNHALTSGGSGNFLQTPVTDQEHVLNRNSGNFVQANNYQNMDLGNNNYAQGGHGFANNGNNFAQNRNHFGHNANNFAQNGNNFAQNGNDFAHNTNNFAQQRINFGQNDQYNQRFNAERPERPGAGIDRSAAILRFDNENDGESFAYAYETDNGIIAEENGVATEGTEAQGGYSYTGDDGQVYTIRYTAGVNGFVPEGDHIPTPPPIPEEILKALEQNARDEAAGIYDDGSYDENKYGSSENYNEISNGNNFNSNYNVNQNANNFNGIQNGNNYNGNQNANNFNGIQNGNNYNGNQNVNAFSEQREDDEDSVVTNNALLRSGNQASVNGFRNGAVDKAYLPPFRSQPNNAYNRRQNALQQANNYETQGFRNFNNNPIGQRNGVENVNLTPFERGQMQGRQGSAYTGQLREPTNGVTNAYLPPRNRRAQNFKRRQF